MDFPPGEEELPEDSAEFIEELHARVDLLAVWESLLRSGDEKIRQRAAERMQELKYGKSGSSSEEPFRLILDSPRPQRD